MIGIILSIISLLVFVYNAKCYSRKTNHQKGDFSIFEGYVYGIIELLIVLYSLCCIVFGHSNSINDEVIRGLDAIHINYLFVLFLHPIMGLMIFTETIQTIILRLKIKKHQK